MKEEEEEAKVEEQEPAKKKHLVIRINKASGLEDKDGLLRDNAEPYVRVRITDQDGVPLVPNLYTEKQVGSTNVVFNQAFTVGPLEKPETALVKLNILDNPMRFPEAAAQEESYEQDAVVELSELEDNPEWQPRDYVLVKGLLWSARLSLDLSTNGTWGTPPFVGGYKLGIRVRSIADLRSTGSAALAAVRIKLVDMAGKQIKKCKETQFLTPAQIADTGFREEDEFINLEEPESLSLRVNILGAESREAAARREPFVLRTVAEDESAWDVNFDLTEVKKVSYHQRHNLPVRGKSWSGTVIFYLSSDNKWGGLETSDGCWCY